MKPTRITVLGVRLDMTEAEHEAQKWFFSANLYRVQADAIRRRGGDPDKVELLERKAKNAEAIANGKLKEGNDAIER